MVADWIDLVLIALIAGGLIGAFSAAGVLAIETWRGRAKEEPRTMVRSEEQGKIMANENRTGLTPASSRSRSLSTKDGVSPSCSGNNQRNAN